MAGHKAANIGLSLNDAAELFADTLPNPADRERARRVYIDRTSGSTESKQLVRSVG
jgi:hypothetical protein